MRAARESCMSAAHHRWAAWRRPPWRRPRSRPGRRRWWRRRLLVEGSKAGAERSTLAHCQHRRGGCCRHPGCRGRAACCLGSVPGGEVGKIIVCSGRCGRGTGGRRASGSLTYNGCCGRARRRRGRESTKKVKQAATAVTARRRGRGWHGCCSGTPTRRCSRRLGTSPGSVIKG